MLIYEYSHTRFWMFLFLLGICLQLGSVVMFNIFLGAARLFSKISIYFTLPPEKYNVLWNVSFSFHDAIIIWILITSSLNWYLLTPSLLLNSIGTFSNEVQWCLTIVLTWISLMTSVEHFSYACFPFVHLLL
jgi:hypothetical protein